MAAGGGGGGTTWLRRGKQQKRLILSVRLETNTTAITPMRSNPHYNQGVTPS